MGLKLSTILYLHIVQEKILKVMEEVQVLYYWQELTCV